ncbi:MAG: PhoU domain-containing protein, partial [Candidatus Bathyarchaeia archaeon]
MSERPLDKGLNRIGRIISDMADSALKTVEASVSAYLEGESAEVQVRAWSDALRSMNNDIEETAVELIARHQPMATDLRVIKSSMKISYDLSRFGRYAYDISHVLQLLDGHSRIGGEDKVVREMCDKVLKMLRLTVDIYKTKDFKKVDELNDLEIDVDGMYRSFLRSTVD